MHILAFDDFGHLIIEKSRAETNHQTTPANRRIRGDMREIFKLLHGKYDTVTCQTYERTRGHVENMP